MKWLLRCLLVALLSAGVWGLRDGQFFSLQVFTPEGRFRFFVVNGVYLLAATAIAWKFPKHLTVVLAASALLYTALVVGPVAILGAALVLASSHALGSLILKHPADPDRRLLAPALGLGLWAIAIGLTAAFPINRPWLYAMALSVPVLLDRGRSFRGAALRSDLSRNEALIAVLAALPLVTHLVTVLKPEASTDALAMHLAIPAWVADFGSWHFDPNMYAWAVYPMAGDWTFTAAYLLGGEFAARLLNLGCLLLWTALLYHASRYWLNRGWSLILAGLFLSTPLASMVTGSLFVENFWGWMLSAGAFAVWRGLAKNEPGFVVTAAVLLGAAIQGKFGAGVMLPVLGAIILVIYPRKRMALSFVLIALAVGAPPYVNAWRHTGNPFYPYRSAQFPSAAAPNVEDLDNPFFKQPFAWDILYQGTFHTPKYVESLQGGMGFYLFLFLPLAFLALLPRGGIGFVAIAVAILYCWAASLAQNNLRYFYPAFTWFLFGFAAFLRLLETLDPPLRRILAALAMLLIPIQTFLMPVASWHHRGYALNPLLRPAETREYIEEFAPTRVLTEHLNRVVPGQTPAILTGNAIAGLRAKAFTNTWHSYRFWVDLLDAKTPSDVLAAMQSRRLRFFIGPTNSSLANPNVGHFLEACTERTRVANSESLYVLRKECEASFDGKAIVRPTALAGRYDDLDLRILFTGTWMRDRQFAEPLNRTLTYTDVPGDSFQITFVGTELVWRFTRASNRGIATVEIDGRPAGEVDQYSADTVWRSEARFGNLPRGMHTAVVRILSRQNPAAKGRFIDVDEIEVR